MAKILTLDTSTNVCSVAIHENGQVLYSEVNKEEKSHSKYITLMVERAVEKTGMTLSELDAFAVSKGPGSYTGLRIGVATVKGYCYALDKQMISVNTLDGMRAGVNEAADFYVPMIDARRMEVYTKVFEGDNKVTQTEAKILEEDSFADVISDHEVLFFGDGSEKYKELTASKTNYKFLDNVFPNAEYMGELVYEKYKNESFEDVAYFEPFYLKDFVTTVPKKVKL